MTLWHWAQPSSAIQLLVHINSSFLSFVVFHCQQFPTRKMAEALNFLIQQLGSLAYEHTHRKLWHSFWMPRKTSEYGFVSPTLLMRWRLPKPLYISGTGNDTPTSSKLEDILQCMSKSIEGKKTLIVLDDVWIEEEKQWENLNLPIIMQNCANGSRILVTTRKEGVAQMMRATTYSHNPFREVEWSKLFGIVQ